MSTRTAEIMERTAAGQTQPEIAAALGVSVALVKNTRYEQRHGARVRLRVRERVATPVLPGDWINRARCRRHDPEMFHPDPTDHAGAELAKAVCRGCPVRTDCLDWAHATGDEHAVLGGTTASERREMRTA